MMRIGREERPSCFRRSNPHFEAFEKTFKNPLALPRGFLIYYALVRHKADLIFEKRQLEIKENYNVTR